MTVPTTGEFVLLIAVNARILPVPLVPKPIDWLLLAQEYPVADPVKPTASVDD